MKKTRIRIGMVEALSTDFLRCIFINLCISVQNEHHRAENPALSFERNGI